MRVDRDLEENTKNVRKLRKNEMETLLPTNPYWYEVFGYVVDIP